MKESSLRGQGAGHAGGIGGEGLGGGEHGWWVADATIVYVSGEASI